MSRKSYVIWNNKGGVGKSTITFHIACMYAEKNPHKDVVIVDMCPQANVSMMVLGGGKIGEDSLQQLIFSNTSTVVSYITDCLTNSQRSSASEYLIKIKEKNDKLSDNLYLLSGDGNLELIASLMSKRAELEPISEKDKPWKNVHLIMKNLTQNNINPERETVYFIDTNPSFSIYTQIAILAGDALLVPINADDSSIFAISGLFNLIYGFGSEHPVYGKYTFASRVQANGIERPKIHLLLGNRFTQKKGAAHAFKALSNEATKTMYEEYKKHPDRFRTISSVISAQGDFDTEFTVELRDFNSAGVVASNLGLPLSLMTEHTYKVYGETIQVAREQRDKCKRVVDELVERL